MAMKRSMVTSNKPRRYAKSDTIKKLEVRASPWSIVLERFLILAVITSPAMATGKFVARKLMRNLLEAVRHSSLLVMKIKVIKSPRKSENPIKVQFMISEMSSECILVGQLDWTEAAKQACNLVCV